MPEFTQTNINLTDDDAAMVDRMMVEDGLDNRSGFMRALVRKEWARRYSRPNSHVTIAEAMTAAEEVQPKP